MAEPKWTPGPWHTEADGTIRSTRDNIKNSNQMADYRGAIVCDLSAGLGDDFCGPIARTHALAETQANARLIAQAPRMYQVVLMAEQVAAMECGEGTAPEFGPRELLDACRAVLAAARGEQG